MADQLLNAHADGIQIILTENGAKLLVQSANQAVLEGNTVKLALQSVAMLHLSLEHLKLFTIIAHRQLKEYETQNQPIALSKNTLEERKIDLAKEW